jgi:hypothetical protein
MTVESKEAIVTPLLDDLRLEAAFETGAEPRGGFHHADHVRLVWIYLGRLPLLAAAERFTAHLRHFAAAQGKADRYHETITLAYLLLIHDRIVTRGRGATWLEFAAMNGDLLAAHPSILSRYYSTHCLGSDAARRTFLWPDLVAPQPCV